MKVDGVEIQMGPLMVTTEIVKLNNQCFTINFMLRLKIVGGKMVLNETKNDLVIFFFGFGNFA